MDKKNILVVGGSGFIGEYLIMVLKDSGQETLVFDRNSKETIDAMVARSSSVVFLTQPNKDLLKEVLAAISKYKISTFLYASTMLLYKGGEIPQKENDQILPVTEYAKNKQEEENIILDFKKQYKYVHIIIARLGNVYGGVKNKGIIGRIFKQLSCKIQEDKLVIFGDGTQVRDFIFVDDIVKALFLLLSKNEDVGVVNITTGHGTSLLEVIDHIEKVTQKKVVYIFKPEILETHSIVGDNTKLQTLIGEVPDTTLLDGLYKTYKRYIIN